MYEQLAKLDKFQSFVVAGIAAVVTIVLAGLSLLFIYTDNSKNAVALLSFLWIPCLLIGFFRGRQYPHTD